MAVACSSHNVRHHTLAGSHIDLGKIIPPAGQRSYFNYYGSLTTPPCTEGLLWHVFEHANHISMAQYRKILLAVNDKDCEAKVSTRVMRRRYVGGIKRNRWHSAWSGRALSQRQ